MDYNLINDNIELKYKIENENVDINLLKNCYDNINKLKLINYDNLANSLIKTLNCNNNIKKVVKIVALTIANTFCQDKIDQIRNLEFKNLNLKHKIIDYLCIRNKNENARFQKLINEKELLTLEEYNKLECVLNNIIIWTNGLIILLNNQHIYKKEVNNIIRKKITLDKKNPSNMFFS